MPVLMGARLRAGWPLAARGLDPPDAQQLSHCLGGLCPARQPRASTLLVDHDRRWFRARVVVADRLDHATVAGGALIGDDDSPKGFLLAAHSREPEPDRHLFLSAGSLL